MNNNNYKIESSATAFESLLKDETIFVQSNGSIGSRNHFSEGYGEYDYPVTLMNGFYNTYPFHYEENYKQFPQVGETIVNLPDASRIEFIFNQEPVNLTNMTLVSVKRTYDLKSGLVSRVAKYQKEKLVIGILEEKIVSIDKDLIITRLTFSANQKGTLTIHSKLRMPRLANYIHYDPRVAQAKKHLELVNLECGVDYGKMVVETTHTHAYLATVMNHDQKLNYEQVEDEIIASIKVDLNQNEFRLTKYVQYIPISSENRNSRIRTNITESFETTQNKEARRLNEFWRKSNIELDHKVLDEVLKYNVFMLYHQSPNDSSRSIAAKGISGEGYEGHYFWDTETYMLPYLILTHPDKARKLLEFRYNMLNDARVEAKNLGVDRGAKIPWRTISGKETSPYYPAGSAQIHINSDIALAYINYYYATLDEAFMQNFGVELLLETALFIVHYGHFKDNQFHLDDVTGPDEYTALVNDNYYTNKLAQIHLEFIYDYIEKNKTKCTPILKQLGIDAKDLENIHSAATQMTLIHDDKLNIIAQDSSFLKKKELEIESIPKDHFPLLLNYHPLYIYKHQILKQADTVLAMVLAGETNLELYKNTVNYYLKRTTHDSSLSKCAYGIAKYQLGESKIATEYFESIAELDFKDLKNHTKHGLHMANAGGSYLMVVYGLLGLKFKEKLHLNPVYQNEIQSYLVHITYQGSELEISYDNRLLMIKASKPIDIVVSEITHHIEHQIILGVK